MGSTRRKKLVETIIEQCDGTAKKCIRIPFNVRIKERRDEDETSGTLPPIPRPTSRDRRYCCESTAITKNFISYLPRLVLQPATGQVLYTKFTPRSARDTAPNNTKIPGKNRFHSHDYNYLQSVSFVSTRGLIVAGSRKQSNFPAERENRDFSAVPRWSTGRRGVSRPRLNPKRL